MSNPTTTHAAPAPQAAAHQQPPAQPSSPASEAPSRRAPAPLLTLRADAAALLIRRDSKAWQLQTWISFALALGLCTTGLAYLPGQDLDRAFMFMGYLFCLSTAFVLSKLVRDAESAQVQRLHSAATPASAPGETPLFRLVVWGSFALAMGLTAWGLVRMNVHPTYKVFLGVAWLYLISSAFTLAKMLRDRQEADALHAHLHAQSQPQAHGYAAAQAPSQA